MTKRRDESTEKLDHILRLEIHHRLFCEQIIQLYAYTNLDKEITTKNNLALFNKRKLLHKILVSYARAAISASQAIKKVGNSEPYKKGG